jgi:LysR family hydrogen peroxide-inducible transcriptional activator
MTLQQLQYIIALDNHRHYVRAAESCHVTQPTLTTQVKKLEEAVGMVIFDRTHTPLRPTPEGERFIAQARRVLHEVKALEALAQEGRGKLDGQFRVGIIPTVAPYLLPRALPRFLERYPEAHLVIEELESEALIAGLKRDAVDVGILATPLEERDLKEMPVYYEPFLAFVPPGHALFGQKAVSPQELAEADLLVLNQGHCFRNQVLNICRKGRAPLAGFSYESGSIETLKNMVKSQMGCTILPELAVQDELDSPLVKRIKGEEPVREISLVAHVNYANALFVKALREVLQESIPPHFRKLGHRQAIGWRRHF